MKRKLVYIWKRVLIAVFAICICFPAVNTLMIKKDSSPLVGVSDQSVFPEFTMGSFYNGSFQKQFEDSFSHGFSGYRTYMRIFNELRFQAFGEAGDTVEMKDGSVIFESYIDEYLGLSNEYACSDEYLEQLADQLKRISDLAQARGKELLVYVTPNKAEFFADQIPDKYWKMKRYYDEEERSVYKLIAGMEENGIAYVDGVALLKSQEYEFDLFPQTGIHWTQEAALQVFDEILNSLESKGFTLKHVTSDGREMQSTPRRNSKNNDDDVWQLMNIFTTMETTYSYPIEKELIPQKYDLPAVFAQGGSFSYNITEAFSNHDVARDVNFLFYNQSLYDYEGNMRPVNDLYDYTIQQKVLESDIILLEVNAQAVNGMGSGFFPILEQILTLNAETASGEFQVEYRGIGPLESYDSVSWRWAYGNNALLVFENAWDSAVEVSYWVPYSGYCGSNDAVPETIEIEVWLNGEYYCSDECSEDSIFTLRIPAEDLLVNRDNTIEIRTPYTMPGATALGEKLFSCQILYAGRAR